MDQNRNNRNKLLAEKVIKGLTSRNMTGYYAENREEAKKLALSLIPEGAVVSWGGSTSISEIGLKQAVIEGNYKEVNRDIAKDRRAAELAAFDADWFLCSTNAMTEDGVLVNIDGNGNRVACMVYGPKHVLFIVGMNKVMKDLPAAISRARNEAAPINAARFSIETPCKKIGSCSDCKSKDTICDQFLITRFEKHAGRYHIILVNDELGF